MSTLTFASGCVSGFLGSKFTNKYLLLACASTTLGIASIHKISPENLAKIDEKKCREYGTGYLVGVIAYNYYTSYYGKILRERVNGAMDDPNIIQIIHKERTSIFGDGSESSIGLSTCHRFIKAYEKVDPNRDISIIIHTPGGAVTAVEAIVNCMLNHTGTGRFIAYIPYYGYSGGCAIALSCHEIVVTKNSIVGPCDGQLTKGFGGFSVSSIMQAVAYKKDHGEPIKEDWLALSRDAEICHGRQMKFLDKIVAKGIMTNETKEKVYEELFTGKYNHDTIFVPDQLVGMGLNVSIVDQMPPEIMHYLE